MATKDILIRSQPTGNPTIQFSGSAYSSIALEVLESGSLAFMGSSGSLFSISDTLIGSLMSVNDISGLPVLEVFSDDRVVMGSFAQNTLVVTGSKVGIGTSTPAYQLEIVPSGMNNIHFSILDEVSNASFQVRGDGFGNAELDMWDGASNNDIHLDTGGVSWFNGGNVGIGTTNPTQKLDIKGSGDTKVRIYGTAGTDDPYLQLLNQTPDEIEGFQIHYDNDVGDSYIDNIYSQATQTLPALRFRTNVNGTTNALVEAMTIVHNGNVGIGITNPTVNLHVVQTAAT